MLPKEYGGGGVSNVDLIIAAEEVCAVDPGFACTVLVNGLGLLPVWYYGTEEQKDRFLRAATSDPSGEYIVGYAASEPAGSPGGTANFDAPLPAPVGIGVTATLDGDEYVLNGRKYWPCNVGRLGRQGRERQHRRRPHRHDQGRHRGAVGDHDRARHARDHLQPDLEDRPPADAERGDHLRQRPRAGREPDRGHARQRRPADQPQLRLVRPGGGHRRGRRRPHRLRGGARLGQDLHGRRPEADHPLPVPRLRARRRRRPDRDVPLLLLEDGALPRPARLPRRDDRRDVQDPVHRAALRRGLQVHAGRRRQQRRQASTRSRSCCARRRSCRSTTPATSACSAAACTA